MTKILAWVAGFAGVIILFLRGRLQAAKVKELRRDVSEVKASEKASKDATEALIRGMEDEAKTTSRGYFDSKSK